LARRARLAAGRLLGAAASDKPLAILAAATLALCASHGFRAEAPRLFRPGLLAVLAGLMAASRLLETSGLLSRLMGQLAGRGGCGGLAALVAASGLSAAVAMNDAVVFIVAPMAGPLSRAFNVEPALLLAVLVSAVNLGSALTPIGNPQNLLIWHDYGLTLPGFTAAMAPLVAAGLALLAAYACLEGRAAARGKPAPAAPAVGVSAWRAAVALALVAVLAASSALGLHRAAAGLLAVAVVAAVDPAAAMAVSPRTLALLALMIADFSYAGSILGGLLPARGPGGGIRVYLASLLLSQAVSNVPAAAMLAGHTRDWVALAYGVNVGGTLTVQGSLANIIALRLAGESPLRLQRRLAPLAAALVVVGLAALPAGRLAASLLGVWPD